MDHKWIVLELNEYYTSDYSEIYDEIIKIFGRDADFFIPIHYEKMGSYISKSVLIDGYVFIKKTPAIIDNLNNIKSRRIFIGPLSVRGKYQTVNSYVVGSLKRKLKKSLQKELKAGAKVEILDGTFKKLFGEVLNIDDEGRRITVKIKRLSREIIAPLPSTIVREAVLS